MIPLRTTSYAQTTTTFSGQAVALRANALGVSLALSDTGPLPSSGGNLKTSLASVNVLGLVSAEVLSSAASGSGTTSPSQSSVANLNLLGGLVAADLVKSNSTATCSGGQATTTGSSDLVGLVVAGTPVLTVAPNLAISAPGGISVIVNEFDRREHRIDDRQHPARDCEHDPLMETRIGRRACAWSMISSPTSVWTASRVSSRIDARSWRPD